MWIFMYKKLLGKSGFWNQPKTPPFFWNNSQIQRGSYDNEKYIHFNRGIKQEGRNLCRMCTKGSANVEVPVNYIECCNFKPLMQSTS